MKIRNGRIMLPAMVLFLSIAIAGCSTSGQRREPLTFEQKISRCALMVLGGAVLAKSLGHDARSGALLGTASCGVWLMFNNKRDKERIAEASIMAMKTGQPQRAEWRGDDGRMRAVKVSFVDSQENTAPVQSARDTGVFCRTMNVQVEAIGVGSDASQTVWCRTPDGSYLPKGQLSV